MDLREMGFMGVAGLIWQKVGAYSGFFIKSGLNLSVL
jgi:hypothetical protein